MTRDPRPETGVSGAALLLKPLDLLEHRLGVSLRIDVRIVLHDAACRVDEKRVAPRQIAGAGKSFQDAIAGGRCLGRIGEDRERQLVPVRKLLVCLDGVDADAQDDGVQFAKGSSIVTELPGLFRAAWGLVLGAEIQRYPIASILCERVPPTLLVLQPQVGRPRTQRRCIVPYCALTLMSRAPGSC